MILRRLEVRNFRTLRELDVEFAPGLNVVCGPNEAGKSTLQAALVALLFADPTSAARDVQAMRSWGAEAMPVLQVEMASPAQEYALVKDFENRTVELRLPDGTTLKDRKRVRERLAELAGVAEKDVYVATACLLQQQWARVSSGAQLQELLQQTLTGGAHGAGVQDILRKLERAIADHERGVRGVAPRNPGRLAQTIARCKEVEEELDKARTAVSAREAAEANLEAARQGLEAINKEAETLASLRQKADRYQKTEQEVGELRQRADEISARLERVRRLEKEIAALATGLQEGPPVDPEVAAQAHKWFERLREREEEIAAGEQEIARLRSECEALEREATAHGAQRVAPEVLEEATRLGEEEKRAAAEAGERRQRAAECEAEIAAGRRRLAGRRWLVACGLALLVVGGALSIRVAAVGGSPGGLPVYLALGGLGAVMTLAGLTRRVPRDWGELPQRLGRLRQDAEEACQRAESRRQELGRLLEEAGCEDLPELAAKVREQQGQAESRQKELAAKRSAIQLREEQVRQAQVAVEELRGKLQEALRESGLDSVERLVEEAEAREEARAQLQSKQSERDGALGGETVEELEERERGLLRDIRAREYELESPELAQARLSPADYEKLLAKIAELNEKRAKLEQRMEEAKMTLAAAQYDADQVAVLEGELRALDERRGSLEVELESYRLAREAIARAQEEVMSETADLISPRMGELVAQLTRNRYCKVRLGPDMRPRVTVSETGQEQELKDDPEPGGVGLSCATREQVFLAARLAIIEMLWPEGGPPVLLDDPLVNFDPDRKAAALEAIRTAAESRQVIVFTCSNEYEGVADTVIRLSGGDGGGQ